jgi:hypothetical protein
MLKIAPLQKKPHKPTTITTKNNEELPCLGKVLNN